MLGWQFTKYQKAEGQSKFDELFTLFQELLVYSSGNVSNAIQWLMEMDREYNLTDGDYGIQGFLEE